MDYRTITDRTSKQFQLLKKGFGIDEHGQLTINDYKVVAMGFDGVEVGNKYRITFSSGTRLKVIIGDIKHTGCNSSDGSMLEMIVDTTKMNKYTLQNNFDSLYKGMITKIEREN